MNGVLKIFLLATALTFSFTINVTETYAVPNHTPVYAFTTPTNPSAGVGEPGVNIIMPAPDLSSVISLKDFQKFIYHPMAVERKSEQEFRSYASYAGTFPVPAIFIRLHRLNI